MGIKTHPVFNTILETLHFESTGEVAIFVEVDGEWSDIRVCGAGRTLVDHNDVILHFGGHPTVACGGEKKLVGAWDLKRMHLKHRKRR